jgi:hypothetical protein
MTSDLEALGDVFTWSSSRLLTDVSAQERQAVE